MQRTTPNQTKWFEQVTNKEQQAFLSKGPAHINNYFNIENFTQSFAPYVRGVRVGSPLPDAEEALEKAEAFLQMLQEKEDLPVLDERSLGIDGACIAQADSCYERTLRIEGVLHIGSLLVTEAFENNYFDGLLEAFIETLSESGPQIHSSLKDYSLNLTNEDTYDIGDFAEAIAEKFMMANAKGFAINACVPVKTYDSDTSYSSGWGYTHYTWVYGESFEEAFAHAEEWADRMDKEDRAAYLAEANQPKQ